MKKTFTIVFLNLILTAVLSCSKGNNTSLDCSPNAKTIRQVNNRQATINQVNGQFYIVEQGSIDTRLRPCSLAQEFQVDNLSVIISGNVKETPKSNPDVCCTENFEITSISK